MDLKNIDLYDLSIEELFNIISKENIHLDFASFYMLRNMLILIIERKIKEDENIKK